MTIDAKDLNAEERALLDQLVIARMPKRDANTIAWLYRNVLECEAGALIAARRALFSPEPAAEPEPKVEPAPVEEGELPEAVNAAIDVLSKAHDFIPPYLGPEALDLLAISDALESWARSLKPQAVELPKVRELVAFLRHYREKHKEAGFSSLELTLFKYAEDAQAELDALPKPAPKVMSEALRTVIGLAEIGWSKAGFDGNFGLLESGLASIAAVRAEYGEPGGKGGE